MTLEKPRSTNAGWRMGLLLMMAFILFVNPLAALANSSSPAFSAGGGSSFAIVDGKLFAWGDNDYGQLGLGDRTDRRDPVQVGTAENWVMVSSGESHTVALNDAGEVWVWGRNNVGQLGLGNTTDYRVPTKLGTDIDWVYVAAGQNSTFAIKANNNLYAWGSNSYGKLGIGSTSNKNTPTQVSGSWTSVSSGENHTLAIKTDGTLWSWGYNNYGQLGQGNLPIQYLLGYVSAPRQVGSASNWTAVSAGDNHSLALNSNGQLYSWGRDNNEQLGNGLLSSGRNTPGLVAGNHQWVSVAAGANHTLAIDADGQLWTWGLGLLGRLGQGSGILDQLPQSSPSKVGDETNWTEVAAGGAHSLALNNKGELFAFGSNSDGQIGSGSFLQIQQSVPLFVMQMYTNLDFMGSNTLNVTKELAGDFEYWQAGSETTYTASVQNTSAEPTRTVALIANPLAQDGPEYFYFGELDGGTILDSLGNPVPLNMALEELSNALGLSELLTTDDIVYSFDIFADGSSVKIFNLPDGVWVLAEAVPDGATFAPSYFLDDGADGIEIDGLTELYYAQESTITVLNTYEPGDDEDLDFYGDQDESKGGETGGEEKGGGETGGKEKAGEESATEKEPLVIAKPKPKPKVKAVAKPRPKPKAASTTRSATTPQPGTTSSQQSGRSMPATGDLANIGLWILMLTGAGTVGVGTVVRKKRTGK